MQDAVRARVFEWLKGIICLVLVVLCSYGTYLALAPSSLTGKPRGAIEYLSTLVFLICWITGFTRLMRRPAILERR